MHTTRTTTTGLVAAMALAAVLIGCSDADDGTSTADTAMDEESAAPGDAATPEPEMGDTDSDEPAADREVGDTPPPSVQAVAAQAGRRVIRTAQLVLEADDPAAVADEVAAIAVRAGGFVAETDLSRDIEGVVSGTITLRVPSTVLVETVDELDALGDAVPVKRIDERDVTSESTDLRAQRTNLARYEAELQGLLSDVRETTTRPDDLLTVFERIRGVRQELDRIEAQLAVLDDQVSLSTIQVTIRPAPAALPVADPTWQPGETVRAALTTTSRTLTGIADVAIWITLTALPIVLVVSAPALVAYVAWRTRRNTHPRTPTPPPAGTVTGS